MRIKYIACFLLGFISQLALSQQSNLGNWLIAFGNKEINEKINWHHEVQYRNYNALGDLEQLLLRTGIGFNITPNANVLGGYGYILSENYLSNTNQKVSTEEHRLFQQLILKSNLKKTSLQHRYRFEQRLFNSDSSENFKLRFRYFIGINTPLLRLEEHKLIYLSAYNEVFLNTESTVFDRNRLYGGLGLKVSHNLKIEIGYMNQFFTTTGRDQVNLISFINW